MSVKSEEIQHDTVFFYVEDFLREYEKFPCLWNRKHEHFKDRKERLKCEEVLGQKLGINDLFTLRRKIRSVRGTYNSEIRKIKSFIDSGGGEVYPPKLAWFPQADRFLRVTTDLPYEVFPLIDDHDSNGKKDIQKVFPLKKRGVSLLLISNPKQSPEKRQKKMYEEGFNIMGKHINKTEQNSTDDYEDYEELEYIDQDETISQDGDPTIKFETLDDFGENQTEHIESTSPICEPESEARSENKGLSGVVKYLKILASGSENEFTAFGRSVGVQLQNMPLEIAVQLQTDIQAHITKTRIQYLQRTRRKHVSECD